MTNVPIPFLSVWKHITQHINPTPLQTRILESLHQSKTSLIFKDRLVGATTLAVLYAHFWKYNVIYVASTIEQRKNCQYHLDRFLFKSSVRSTESRTDNIHFTTLSKLRDTIHGLTVDMIIFDDISENASRTITFDPSVEILPNLTDHEYTKVIEFHDITQGSPILTHAENIQVMK